MSQGSRREKRRDGNAVRGIAAYRVEIDRLDGQILKLLNRRARLAEEIGKRKLERGRPTFVPGRERRLFASLLRANPGPLPDGAVLGIFREIVAASRALEGPVRVAFLGPEATFTEAAARIQFGSTARYVAADGIRDVFATVESERAHFGVVPVENSTEGVVTHTLDSLVDSPLKICGEVELRIRQCLMAGQPTMDGVRRITSHPQSLAQCRQWLAATCPRVATEVVSSNGRAAEIAARDGKTAAIVGAWAAERYGLHIIAQDIQDDPRNVTRFIVVSQRDSAQASGADKTSIAITVRDEVGVLQQILRPFSTNAINLCGIESRPLRGKPWEYVFFLDLRKHRQEAAVKRALAEVSRHCLTLKILGSYPVALPEAS